MKRISIIFFFLLVSAFAIAQTKNFELLNPDAIELTEEQLAYLTTRMWKVNSVDTQIRDEIVNTKGWAFLEFGAGNGFEYGGKSGNWALLENKYFRYQLNNPEDEARLNFGGIYSVTSLTDSTLVLSKVLTSARDMKRTIHLYNFKYFYDKRAPEIKYPYWGEVSNKVLDSISHLSEETLLKVGDFHGLRLVGDTIHIHTPDTIVKIRKKD
ncbi:hypothetical protein [Cesiribacter sp. SM1]|uniref:hypothetical protein n=1 Tax=Cesiribacter sp. SM1 TaxID=2861196 RepID=UPI001CD23500|nr:hypothetical protein [Cesiribacter sp. SM1]